MPDISVRLATSDDMTAVRDLCRAYRAVLAERMGDRADILDRYYGDAGFELLLSQLPVLHARPKGAIFVGLVDGQIRGCAMTHEIAPGVCEIKRLYTDPDARGLGLARAICKAAINQAYEDGYVEMKLDTMKCLPEAIALYRDLGFSPCAPFYDLPPDFEGYVFFMGRGL